jgi:hypothetical protein
MWKLLAPGVGLGDFLTPDIHVRVLIHVIVLIFTINSCCLSVTPSPLYYK